MLTHNTHENLVSRRKSVASASVGRGATVGECGACPVSLLPGHGAAIRAKYNYCEYLTRRLKVALLEGESVGERAELGGELAVEGALGHGSIRVAGVVDVRQEARPPQHEPVVRVGLVVVERVLAPVADRVERLGRLDEERRVPAAEGPGRGQVVALAEVLERVGDRGGTQAHVLVRLEGEHHVLHEELEERMAGVECHHAVLHPVGDEIDRAERVLQAVERAQDDAVEVQVDAAALPQNRHSDGVAPVDQLVL